jgi:hypothetical protein
MASQNSDEMISIGGRWWSFPGAQIEMCSSEFEWRDGKLWLHESTGNVIEGTEVSDGTTEHTVWHYTYDHIVDILESGVLLPPRMTPHFNDLDSSILQLGESINKDKGFQADSTLLLFSQRADWEPASYRGLTVGGRIIDLFKLEDYEAYGKRVYRVGVSRDLLHPWMRLKRLCGMPPAMARALEKTARERGGNPFDWWGTMRPIPQDKWRSVEVYNPATKAWESLFEEIEDETEALPMAAD